MKYTGKEKVVYGATEVMAQDSVFSVLFDEDEDRYHLECQSTPDAHLAVRFYEQDAADAVATAWKTGKFIFPSSAVVYLRPPASLEGSIELPVYPKTRMATSHPSGHTAGARSHLS